MSTLKTRFTEMFGIDHPIALAPMGGAVEAELAAAVSNAGGFGILPLSWSDPDTIHEQLLSTQEATDKPFAVNLCIENSQDKRLGLCLEHEVRAVHFFWGDAGPYVKRVHSAGAKVIQTVSSSDEAKRACDAGVDVLIAQGWEAGGHVRGKVASMPLIPSVTDVSGEIPVLAAGGMADGRSLAAAMALGASGIVMGTRFLASAETCAHPDYVAQILSADDNDTIYAKDLFNVGWSNAPHRVLRSALTDRWFEDDCPDNIHRFRAGETVTRSGDVNISAYQSATPHKSMSGEITTMSMWAGQSCGLVSEITSASGIIKSTVTQAISIIEQQSKLLTGGVLNDG
ncbi:NAD(P)H-dependent flavin oxidoreductase [Lentilitoribacter sp. EG35]|uniref:NAD(P)H-dependent flavin oxidoreductase n=1 Tax=Lentilitoribacter sp. EG35 TaxID=3234192 RepID=UPI00345F1D1A